MIKVLVLATMTQAVEHVKELLPKGCIVRSGVLPTGSSLPLDETFHPDVIIAFVENISRQRLFTIIDMREQPEYEFVPMLAIGKEQDLETFDKNVKPGADRRFELNGNDMDMKIAIESAIELRTIVDQSILVVDDDPVFLKMARGFLEDNYQVTTVKSGKLAIKFLEKQKPDLILLDYMMPEWDGATTYQLIRSKESTKRIPIVFITGITDKTKVMECLSLKPQGYMVKPLTKNELLSKVREII